MPKRKELPMSKSFYEEMKKATKVKYKNENTSQYHILSSAALRQKRRYAIKNVCREHNCTELDIANDPHKYENDLRAAFTNALNDYAESVIPASNPSRQRARTVMATYDNIFGESGSYIKNNFPKANQTEQRDKSLTIKSGAFKIADVFIEGTGKINPKTDEKIGSNFSKGMKDKREQLMVYRNRYYFYVVTAILYGLLEKMFSEVSNQSIESFLKKNVDGKTIGELQDKTFSDSLTSVIRTKMKNILSSIDINNAIK